MEVLFTISMHCTISEKSASACRQPGNVPGARSNGGLEDDAPRRADHARAVSHLTQPTTGCEHHTPIDDRTNYHARAFLRRHHAAGTLPRCAQRTHYLEGPFHLPPRRRGWLRPSHPSREPPRDEDRARAPRAPRRRRSGGAGPLRVGRRARRGAHSLLRLLGVVAGRRPDRDRREAAPAPGERPLPRHHPGDRVAGDAGLRRSGPRLHRGEHRSRGAPQRPTAPWATPSGPEGGRGGARRRGRAYRRRRPKGSRRSSRPRRARPSRPDPL